MADETEPGWQAALRDALEQLPNDYPTFYAEVTKLRHTVQSEIAAALQKRLNQHVANQPQHAYVDKQQLAQSVNRDLRLLNLCLRCPVTGNPAILVADFRDDQEKTSRFRFQSFDASGKRMNKASSPSVSNLVVQEAPPREENFASRRR